MKILVIGAGPAGLMFASQIKKLHPEWDLRIVEKNHVDDNVVGWGVVLPGHAQKHPANPLTYTPADKTVGEQYLNEFKLTHNNKSVRKDTNVTLCGAERKALVRELRQLCAGLDIPIEYEKSIEEESDLDTAAYDLVVMSTGISHTSAYYREALKPKVKYGSNRYMWYGTSQVFDAMNLIFKKHDKGVFVAHSYKYSNNMSTFVVECSEETYQKVGLDKLSEGEAEDFVATLFKEELEGHSVQTQSGLKWRNFMKISHEKSYDGNIALVGDALQSGHFSIGHGTTMAVVGAQILVKAVHDHSENVALAMEEFNNNVMPVMQLFDKHATASQDWFESVENKMDLSVEEIAHSFSERRGHLPPLPAALAQVLGRALDRGVN
uniref:VioD hydroxylase n=2 Tax=gamma proteobacterium D250 TaxID=649546 RepID=M4HXH6_9GAMM|nr:VioD hydroxylase [gamma proteobacterium D250]AFT64166.1 VioD hydroxylase [gamma proteobacterium D250]